MPIEDHVEKTLAECGYCGYVWVLKLPDITPKMCPRDKKRFLNAEGAPSWATKKVKLWKESFPSYDALRKRLSDLNGGKKKKRK